MAKATTTNPNTPAPATLTNDEITAALRGAGMIENRQEFPRIRLDGLTFHAGEEMYISNPKTNTPAFLAQIVTPPAEYQSRWFEDDGVLARAVGRPEIAGHMCKSHFDVDGQRREYAEDGTSCRKCPVNPFVRRDNLPPEAREQRCSWRGDVELRILDEDGQMIDETVWTMSLPTTGMIEWKGTSKEPEKGSATELNFMQRLARLGAESNPDNPTQGIFNAMTALSLGHVVAEVRSIPQQAQNGNRYSVISFTPVVILPVEEQPALETSTDTEASPVPF